MHPTFQTTPRTRRNAAFTLVEMLVVIGIIGLLAAMIFPLSKAVTQTRMKKKAQAQLAQIGTFISTYQTKLGFYPPDNPLSALTNQLFYELVGTTVTNNGAMFVPLNGGTNADTTVLSAVFGAQVTGFMNTTKGGSSDDVQGAVNFAASLRPDEFLPANINGKPWNVIGSPDLPGPVMLNDGNGHSINPWQYNSSHPTNNPSSYDLWIDVIIGGKTNRISNWSSTPIVL